MYSRGKRPEFDIILDQMCEFVGAEDVDFSTRGWRFEYKWAQCEQDEFESWLVAYLMRYSDAREEIMAYPSRDKKEIQKTARGFIRHCGWKDA